jgi:hypothetical protein
VFRLDEEVGAGTDLMGAVLSADAGRAWRGARLLAGLAEAVEPWEGGRRMLDALRLVTVRVLAVVVLLARVCVGARFGCDGGPLDDVGRAVDDVEADVEEAVERVVLVNGGYRVVVSRFAGG